MMMFSVSDILGLNPFMRKVLANAAGAAPRHGAGESRARRRKRATSRSSA